jgi:hypothetical protein
MAGRSEFRAQRWLLFSAGGWQHRELYPFLTPFLEFHGIFEHRAHLSRHEVRIARPRC